VPSPPAWGGTFSGGEGTTAEALLARADHALYEVKRQGKNAFHWEDMGPVDATST
jgi:GGDEF domain-containing protein